MYPKGPIFVLHVLHQVPYWDGKDWKRGSWLDAIGIRGLHLSRRNGTVTATKMSTIRQTIYAHAVISDQDDTYKDILSVGANNWKEKVLKAVNFLPARRCQLDERGWTILDGFSLPNEVRESLCICREPGDAPIVNVLVLFSDHFSSEQTFNSEASDTLSAWIKIRNSNNELLHAGVSSFKS